MKRLTAAFAAFLIMITMSGCIKTAADSEIMPSLTETDSEQTESFKATDVSESEAATYEETQVSSSESTQAEAVSTDCFTIYIPNEIKDKIETVVPEEAMSVGLYQTGSEEGSGKLLSINLYDDDYSFLPSYDLIGKLTSEDGKEYSVVAMYPTDVQYMPEDEEEYKYLAGFAETVLRSFTPADGYVFDPSFDFTNMPEYMK